MCLCVCVCVCVAWCLKIIIRNSVSSAPLLLLLLHCIALNLFRNMEIQFARDSNNRRRRCCIAVVVLYCIASFECTFFVRLLYTLFFILCVLYTFILTVLYLKTCFAIKQGNYGWREKERKEKRCGCCRRRVSSLIESQCLKQIMFTLSFNGEEAKQQQQQQKRCWDEMRESRVVCEEREKKMRKYWEEFSVQIDWKEEGAARASKKKMREEMRMSIMYMKLLMVKNGLIHVQHTHNEEERESKEKHLYIDEDMFSHKIIKLCLKQMMQTKNYYNSLLFLFSSSRNFS